MRESLERVVPNGIVGTSAAFLECVEQAERIASYDIPVLIEGETGTGKELIARQIHSASQRSNRAFIGINCAAVPRELMESEFFGHRRGAFTHAVSDRGGYVAEAHLGTLFLDEVSSLDLGLQAKLLRFLQEGEYRQVGGVRLQSANVRIIAASNEPLEHAAEQGRFRWDLFYRLAVFQLRLPALRERQGDIRALLDHFLTRYSREFGLPQPQLAPEATAALLAGAWPGNVRQLQNLCQRLVIERAGRPVDVTDLDLDAFEGTPAPDAGTDAVPFQEQKAEVIRQFEVAYLHRLLSRFNGNVSRAARSAGKHRRALHELLRKHRIDPADYRLG